MTRNSARQIVTPLSGSKPHGISMRGSLENIRHNYLP